MEQAPNTNEKKESREEKLARLLRVVESTDLAQFAEASEVGLMQRAERSAVALIEQSQGDPYAFLELLKGFDPELQIVKDSAVMAALAEFSPSAGGAFLEKKTIKALKELFVMTMERVRAKSTKGLEGSMKQTIDRYLNSQSEAGSFIDKLQKAIDELDSMQRGICFRKGAEERTALIYHEGIHAIQEAVGFYATKMEDMQDIFNLSSGYARVKFLTELQTNKLVLEAQGKGVIPNSDDERMTEASYFGFNLEKIREAIKKEREDNE